MMTEPISPKQFAKEMTKIKDFAIREYVDEAANIDLVMLHIQADNLLCETLRSLGYGDGVDVYHRINKYYSPGE